MLIGLVLDDLDLAGLIHQRLLLLGIGSSASDELRERLRLPLDRSELSGVFELLTGGDGLGDLQCAAQRQLVKLPITPPVLGGDQIVAAAKTP